MLQGLALFRRCCPTTTVLSRSIRGACRRGVDIQPGAVQPCEVQAVAPQEPRAEAGAAVPVGDLTKGEAALKWVAVKIL